MINIINKYYEPELKQVRCIISEDELIKLTQLNAKLHGYLFEIRSILTDCDLTSEDIDEIWKIIKEWEHENSTRTRVISID